MVPAQLVESTVAMRPDPVTELADLVHQLVAGHGGEIIVDSR